MALRALERRARRLRAVVIALSAALVLGAHAQQSFKVRLRPVPIEASIAAATTGAGEATAQLERGRLVLRGSFSGLQGVATAARLHQGPVMGVRGPAFADVNVPGATSGNFSAEVALSAAQIEALRQGQIYLQIHSASAPEGNLWGWVLP